MGRAFHRGCHQPRTRPRRSEPRPSAKRVPGCRRSGAVAVARPAAHRRDPLGGKTALPDAPLHHQCPPHPPPWRPPQPPPPFPPPPAPPAAAHHPLRPLPPTTPPPH